MEFINYKKLESRVYKLLIPSAQNVLALYFNLKYNAQSMQVKTKISRSKAFDKQLDKVPDFIQKKFMFWVFLVETNGIAETARSPGFHDEPLKGNRFGQRSVRMNKAYRLIYRVIEGRVHIELLEINKHEY